MFRGTPCISRILWHICSVKIERIIFIWGSFIIGQKTKIIKKKSTKTTFSQLLKKLIFLAEHPVSYSCILGFGYPFNTILCSQGLVKLLQNNVIPLELIQFIYISISVPIPAVVVFYWKISGKKTYKALLNVI